LSETRFIANNPLKFANSPFDLLNLCI